MRLKPCRFAAISRPGSRNSWKAKSTDSWWPRRRSIGCWDSDRLSIRRRRSFAPGWITAAGWCCRCASFHGRRRKARFALEIAAKGVPICDDLLAPILCESTTASVNYERQVLTDHGGGCHQALGAAVIEKPVRARGQHSVPRTRGASTWQLEGGRRSFPRASEDAVWPRRNEGVPAVRTSMDVEQPSRRCVVACARAEALPGKWSPPPKTIVWAAGSRPGGVRRARQSGCMAAPTAWEMTTRPAVDLLAGRSVDWVSLTHDRASRRRRAGHVSRRGAASRRPAVAVAFLLDERRDRSAAPSTAGRRFARAGMRRARPYATTPSRPRLGASDRTGVWLDRESWEKDVCL